MPLKTKSILTPSEQNLFSRLQGWLVENRGSEYQVVCKTTLPAIADIRLEDDQTPDTFWTSILDFCVVANRVHGNTKLVLVWSDNPNRETIELILGEYAVPVIRIERESTKDDFNSLISEVGITLRQRQSKHVSKMPKTMVNVYEKWLHERAAVAFYGTTLDQQNRREILGGAEYIPWQIFIEPCLSEFIEIPKESGNEVFEYGCKSRADILITKHNSCLTPLLQLEFDGPDHDKPKGRRNDRKKEELLEQAGIPLLRIAYDELPFTLETTRGNRKALSISYGTEESKEIFDDVFSNLCKWLVINSSFAKVELPSILEPSKRAWQELARQKFDDARRTSISDSLQHDAIASIFASVDEEMEETYWAAEYEIRAIQRMATDSVSPKWSSFDDLLGITKATLTFDDENSDEQAGYHAILDTPDETLSISVPNIHLNYFCPDPASFGSTENLPLFPDVTFTELVIQLAMGTVRKLLLQQHSKNPFKQYISQGELDEYRRFWHRPKSELEKSFLKACAKLLSDEREAEIDASLSKLSPDDRAEIEKLRGFDVNSLFEDDSCKAASEPNPHSLPDVNVIPTVYEYSKKFNRSPYACVHYPGVSKQLLSNQKDVGNWTEDKNALERKLRHEEIQLAIELKEAGVVPRLLNPV